MKIATGQVTLTGVRQPLTTKQLDVAQLVLKTLSTNVGNAYYGDNTVTAGNGMVIEKGETIKITATYAEGDPPIDVRTDLLNVLGTTNDVISWLAFLR